VIPLSVNSFRVPINGPALLSTAAEILQQASTPEKLQNALGWDEFPENFQAGFAPQKNAGNLVRLLKNSGKRSQLRNKRIARGYPDFLTPRKGFKGWWQRSFSDPAELKLPIGYDVLAWLQQSPRFGLLTAIHDALLNAVSVAEPKKADRGEMGRFPNPLGEMVYTVDLQRAERLRQALAAPLKKVKPDVIVDDLSGFVIAYEQKLSFAYFYA